jgi:hypothetical protein
MPAITWAKSLAGNRLETVGLEGVSEMLIRLTPASFSSWANFGSWLPLVISVSSSRRRHRVARARAEQPQDVLAHQRLARR